MAKLPTPTVVGGVSSDTYSVFNDENASKKVGLSKVVVNEFSEVQLYSTKFYALSQYISGGIFTQVTN